VKFSFRVMYDVCHNTSSKCMESLLFLGCRIPSRWPMISFVKPPSPLSTTPSSKSSKSFLPHCHCLILVQPNLSHVLGTCSNHLTLFSHLLKSVTHVPHHRIHSCHHLRHGLHLKFKFYIKRGWCVVLIWHDRTCKNWLVVKKILTSLVFRSNTLNILTRSNLVSPSCDSCGIQTNTK